MAWGKIIGGTIGALLGGPLGAGVGIALGAGVDEEMAKQDDASSPVQEGGLSLAQTGNVLRLTSTIQIPPSANQVVVRIQHQNQLAKSFVPDFKDDDGDFVIGKRIVGWPLSVDVPLGALLIDRNAPQLIRAVVIVFRDDEQLGMLAGSSHVRIANEAWSAMRWREPVVTLLKHYALRSGTWTPEKVKLIKSAFEPLLQDGAVEAEALRDLLKQPIAATIDDCIAAFHRRFDLEDLATLAVFGSAQLLALSQAPERVISDEIDALGERLRLDPNHLDDLKRDFFDGEGNSADDGHAGPSADRQRACVVLGVPEGASREVIQQAWRKKISELHPDKYANLPEVVQNMIKEKAQELNQARDTLLK